MGLFIKDSSPIREAFKPSPLIKPIINLIPVPELPKSTELSGFTKAESRADIFTESWMTEISEPI